MARYVARRLLHALVLILVTLTVTFFVIHLAPGSPVALYHSPDIDPSAMARVRADLGLDDPLPVQFARWLSSFARGDFGMSVVHHRPVADMLGEVIPRTLLLMLLAFAVQIAVGVVSGVLTGARRGTRTEAAVSLFVLVLYAVPTFYLAYLLIGAFALKLGWLPATGMESVAASHAGFGALLDRLRHLVLPVTVLGVASAASLARYARGSMVDALGEDFVRTARAKGLTEGTVVWRHALRNALPPVMTVIGLSVPFLLGGAVVVEKVFAWPGMGSLVVDAIFARDYPVVLATNFIAAVMVIAGNLIADLATAWLDPRTKLASVNDRSGTT